MKYYILTMQDGGGYRVIGDCNRIAWARKKIAELIDFDLQVWGYTNGYYICTATAEKEYHGARLTDNSRFCMRHVGSVFKPVFSAAIAEFIADRKRRDEMLDAVNADRVAFPSP